MASVAKKRPLRCGTFNAEQNCLSCGRNSAVIKEGFCPVTDGDAAIKTPQDLEKEGEYVKRRPRKFCPRPRP